ncbi:MAG: FG-GAP repeat protein, partial [Planctomycetes bacterium]|nr:FG-GAP repeat protein [Planctomycetota bacterium]
MGDARLVDLARSFSQEYLVMFTHKKNMRWIRMVAVTLGCLALVGPARADWPLDDRITAGTNGADNDRFGYAVAISGEYAIVGAYFDDDNQQTDSGSAYIFSWSGTGWAPYDAKITAGVNAEANAWFGNVVAIDGDYAIVGADNEDAGSLAESGAAYIFVRSGTSWSRQARLTAESNGEVEAYFGHSVSIGGSYAIVGAPHETVSGMSNAGAAYVFIRSDTSWSRQARLTAGTDAAAGDGFGGGVSISGDYVIVGAGCDDDTAQNSGSAYIFQRSGTSWSRVAKLTASDAGFYDLFGVSVSLSGDCAIVGSISDDWGGMTHAGSAYIFEKPATGWANMTETAKLTASDAAGSDYMGQSVGISGDYAIVSAHEEDTNGTQSGSAYIFEK